MYFPRLKELREEHRMSQKHVAELLNTGVATYARYESGVRTMPTRCLVILANFYDVSADYIVGRTDRKKRWQ